MTETNTPTICLSCGNEIKVNHTILLGNFCNEKCFWAYEDGKETPVTDYQPIVSITNEMHLKIIKKAIDKNKLFIISNITLRPYLNTKIFDDFMNENKYVLLKHDNDLSVIKKM